MENDTVYSQVESAIEHGDAARIREIISRHPPFLKEDTNGFSLLSFAAARDNTEMVALLVELGADVNAAESADVPEGAILAAAREGAFRTVRWLLDHGAQINHRVEGETRCWALTGAARGGYLDVVRLLVERGADINATWAGLNALSFAIMDGQKEIEAFLRSKGAKEPLPLAFKEPTGTKHILDHIERHLGEPSPLSLQEVAPGDLPISIHVVRMRSKLALVTAGMSQRPMTVPEGGEAYRYAELVMYLPLDWPLTEKALHNVNYSWPIQWLRWMARYPHENQTWLGGPKVVVSNGEPPRPFAPNTQLSCLLAVTEASDFGWLWLGSERAIVFYSLYPLYAEERDLEKKYGTERLLELFEQYMVSQVLDVRRPNVASLAGFGC